MADHFVETRAFVYSETDPISPAKIIVEGAKTHEKMKVISGSLITDGIGTFLSESAIKELASLPSREELIVKLLFLFNAPITQFVKTLNEVPSKFVRTLQAVADNKK